MFFILLIGIENFKAQSRITHSAAGFVYDNSNGEALIGANVYLKELGYGSSSNDAGYFVIPEIPSGEYTLVCSYIGFETESINIVISGRKENEFNFRLNPTSIRTSEVIVSGDSVSIAEKLFARPISKIELSPKQINEIPKFVEADLLRALQSMPGILALSDFSSALYVRGGVPDQNLFLIDGTDVYNPEHAFGIFSTFNTNAIKKVEVSKGGFGAEYGGRLSSVLNVTNLDGNRNEFEGIFNLSLLSASTTLQLPIGDIGSISGSIRRTYIDQTYEKFIDEIPKYYFYDGNLKAFFDLDNKNKLSISFFKGRDDLDYKFDKEADESFSFLYDWGNTTGSINWKHIFSQKLFSSFWVTGSEFDSNFELDAIELSEYNYLSDVALKASLEYYASQNFNVKFGAEQKFVYGSYKQEITQQKIDIADKRYYTGAYLSASWKPSPDWAIEPGLRVNYFQADTAFLNFAPRFMVKYKLDDQSSLKFATGIYYQYANKLRRLFFASVWTSVNKYYPESSSAHFILGYQRSISDIWEFEVELYSKSYKNLYQFNPNAGTQIEPTHYDEFGRPVYGSYQGIFNSGDGHSYGLELMLKKEMGEINGWISYSYSQTKYEFKDINSGDSFAPRHDRASVVNSLINFDLNGLLGFGSENSSWKMGINFVYASGQPLTLPGSAYYSNRLPDWQDLNGSGENNPNYNLYPGEINSFRLPDYIRMDLSITYEKDYGSWSLSPYLQIFNIGNRKNLWFIQYQHEIVDGNIIQTVEEVNMLPILPSLGVTIKF